MKNPVLNKETRSSFFYRGLNQVAPWLLFFLVYQVPIFSYGQSESVLVTENQNNIHIQEVRYTIDGQDFIQTSPEGNENPLPEDIPVHINSILIEGDRVIYTTTRNPLVKNPNPVLGSNEIASSAVQIVRSDNIIISHRNPEFYNNLEMVVSNPDLRSYWDICAQPSIARGDHFVDLMYSERIVSSGYLLYTERGGNSATDFIALDKNGEPIENAKVIEVRGWQWDTGINHVTIEPQQTQELILFSPMIFESTVPIYGIRIIAGNEPDGKLVFFVNELSAKPDLAERVCGEVGAEAVLNIFDNDELNCLPLDPIDVEVELVEPFPNNTIILHSDGTVDVPPKTAPGVYTAIYEITTAGSVSDQAEIRIEVIDCIPEAFDDHAHIGDIFGQDGVLNVLSNDFLNGLPALIENVNLTELDNQTDGALILNEDGSVDVAVGTAEGKYQLTYQICDKKNPSNCDQASVTIEACPLLLDVSKTSDSSEVPVGGMVTYTIQLTNNSKFELANIVVEDVLPDGLEFLSSIPTPEETGTWIIESLPSGSSNTITIEAIATGMGQVVNIANVVIGNYTDQIQSLPVSILARPVEICISKTSFGIEIYKGNEFEYEIRLSNTGSNIAENITIEDVLPSGLVFLNFSSEGFEGSPNVSGNTISWIVPSIEAGEEMVFRMRVQANQVGVISNTAVLRLPEGQENLSPDREATDTNQVRSFFIPNVITPGNLDGKNDTFKIRGLQGFASNSLTILNRNGDHVYESDDYQNDWAANGQNAGSYYFVLAIKDSQGVEQIYKGWVQVIK